MGLVSAKEYAELKGVSPMAVTKWLKAGKLGSEGDAWQKNGAHYLIDTDLADALLEQNQKVTLQRSPSSSRTAREIDPEIDKISRDYTKHRSIGAGYDAYLKKLDYEMKIGALVRADDVKTEAYTLFRSVRDSILNIPDRIAPIVAAEQDTEKVRSLLNSELLIALESLSSETNQQQ
jgi:hypothetical protein